ncbi:MAG: hypothetical protein LBC80_02920 [Treponema sp.]|nr:hypothetical protein [Treponema sp.]
MKKIFFLPFAFLILSAIIFSACNQEPEEERIFSIEIEPDTKTMVHNQSLTFRPVVHTTGGATRAVTWSVAGTTPVCPGGIGGCGGTSINVDTGLLAVCENETNTTLTITAKTIFDYPRYYENTAVVTIVTAFAAPVNAAELTAELNNILAHAQGGTPQDEYILFIGEDIEDFVNFTVPETFDKTISIRILGTRENTITWKPVAQESRCVDDGRSLFIIQAETGSVVTFILDDIFIESSAANVQSTSDLISVRTGGKLEIRGETVLTNRFLGISHETGDTRSGNHAINIRGGEVILFNGSIIDNSRHGVRFSPDSEDGKFTMSGGLISRNAGHGVLLEGLNNTFTMTGGVISHQETNNHTGVRFGAGRAAARYNCACQHQVALAPSVGTVFTMSGGTITNNDFGIRVVYDAPRFTLNGQFIMTGGTIRNSSRQEVQIHGAPGFLFDKSGPSIIEASNTSRIQIRNLGAGDIADYRDLAGLGYDLRLQVDNTGNGSVPNSDNGTASNWRLIN